MRVKMQIDVMEIIGQLSEQTLQEYKGGAKLKVIQVGDDPASNLYVKSKTNELPKWNIEVDVTKFDADITARQLEWFINEYNKDKSINGIIVQLPLPDSLKNQEENILLHINDDKNVDGFKKYFDFGNTIRKSYFEPCTPRHNENHQA